MILLDGKLVADQMLAEIQNEVSLRQTKGEKIPHLAAILVGNDGASETYVANKVKTCAQVGFQSTLVRFPQDVTEAVLIDEIKKINQNPEIDGLIVQLPLPKHISESLVTQTILPQKDVDGFHPINIGRMALNLPTYISATPNGILEILSRYKIETASKNCVVIGRSHIVGSPMSILMARNAYPGNSTVTLCHSKTKNLKEICLQADIIISATGIVDSVSKEMVKEGAVVIDVGMTRVPDASKKSGFRLRGDVDFENVAPKCSYITPVPGGVGLTTIASLLSNTMKAARGDVRF